MILIRNVFRLKFGKAKEAKEALKKLMQVNTGLGYENARLLSDVTGTSYTLVLEMEVQDLSFLDKMKEIFGNPDWQNAYREFVPFAESGYREIFLIES